MEKQKRKLYRSRTNRIIAGVCGGLGQYFDIDPILVRGVFILLALIDGLGILLYLILLIIVPKEPGSKAEVKKEEKIHELAHGLKDKAESLADEFKDDFRSKESSQIRRKTIIGIIIIAIGSIFLLERVFSLQIMRWSLLWPAMVILIGFLIIFKKKK